MAQWKLLDILPEIERQRVLKEMRRRRFARNEVIFHGGDPGDSMHVVSQGHVAIRVHTPMGDIATLRLVTAGELFGELAVVSPGPRNATAIALDATETLVLTRAQLEVLRLEYHQIDELIIEVLVHEVRRLARQVVDLMYVPAEKRVWRVLANLSIAYGTSAGPGSDVPLTQDVIAQLTGCTRPTANHILRSGQSDRVIAIKRGGIEILDNAALAKLAR